MLNTWGEYIVDLPKFEVELLDTRIYVLHLYVVKIVTWELKQEPARAFYPMPQLTHT